MAEPKKRRYLTAEQVAEELDLKERTVVNWRSRQVPYGPPFTHIGGVVRYPAEMFEEWCKEQNSKAINQ